MNVPQIPPKQVKPVNDVPETPGAVSGQLILGAENLTEIFSRGRNRMARVRRTN
jgi:hypothetical protein